STAKRVRRYGVDPNRSCNEEITETIRAATFQATPTLPQAIPTLWNGPSSTGQLPPSTSARPPPLLLLSGAVGKRSSFGRFSNLRFSLIRTPNQSCEASEAKLNHRRDLQEVQLARTSSGNIWVCSNYRGDFAEFSARV
ncbi:serine carboxypeptidase-like 40, partial [Prunus dulcis]